MHEHFLSQAIEEAVRGVRAGHGGPFGALVVREGVVLARAHNRVLASHDPTAHAEIVAIREACGRTGEHALHGAVLYASCEPCPMCAAAAFWARLERVYFAATSADAAGAGFDDQTVLAELRADAGARALPRERIAHGDARAPFEAWQALAERILY